MPLKGTIGILRNGVALFASIDEQNRDAVAYESEDQCDGHPEQSLTYHYHSIPSCVLDAATGPSTVIRWTADGFRSVERDADGNLPTDATSTSVTAGRVDRSRRRDCRHVPLLRHGEFPYFIGCFRGTPQHL